MCLLGKLVKCIYVVHPNFVSSLVTCHIPSHSLVTPGWTPEPFTLRRWGICIHGNLMAAWWWANSEQVACFWWITFQMDSHHNALVYQLAGCGRWSHKDKVALSVGSGIALTHVVVFPRPAPPSPRCVVGDALQGVCEGAGKGDIVPLLDSPKRAYF